jgi:hypothetical protein
MTKSTRKLTGWPPDTTRPASAAEIKAAHEQGVTIKQLRQADARIDAAEVLEQMLNDMPKSPDAPPYPARLSIEQAYLIRQRWALHVAIGVLRGLGGKQ